eukprot:7329020-Prymnesium_polylepis.2
MASQPDDVPHDVVDLVPRARLEQSDEQIITGAWLQPQQKAAVEHAADCRGRGGQLRSLLCRDRELRVRDVFV